MSEKEDRRSELWSGFIGCAIIALILFWFDGIKPAYKHSRMIDRGRKAGAYIYDCQPSEDLVFSYSFHVNKVPYEGGCGVSDAKKMTGTDLLVGDSIDILYNIDDPSVNCIAADTQGTLVHLCYRYRKLMGATAENR